jgi:hypothetical protein
MSTSSLQGNPLKFPHADLRKLNQDKKNAFQKELAKIVRHYKRCTPVEAAERKLSNSQILRVMKQLLTHLNRVCAASGPESKLQGYFWSQYAGWKASDDDRKVIARFPKMAELMRRIVADSITSESYKIRPLATELPHSIAMQAAQLLGRFEIETPDTVKGVWFELTKYILHHGCGRDETPANILNYLKDFQGCFSANKGGKITR